MRHSSQHSTLQRWAWRWAWRVWRIRLEVSVHVVRVQDRHRHLRALTHLHGAQQRECSKHGTKSLRHDNLLLLWILSVCRAQPATLLRGDAQASSMCDALTHGRGSAGVVRCAGEAFCEGWSPRTTRDAEGLLCASWHAA